MANNINAKLIKAMLIFVFGITIIITTRNFSVRGV